MRQSRPHALHRTASRPVARSEPGCDHSSPSWSSNDSATSSSSKTSHASKLSAADTAPVLVPWTVHGQSVSVEEYHGHRQAYNRAIVRCTNLAHCVCSKKRNLNVDNGVGPRGLEAFLGARLEMAAGMSRSQHVQFKPSRVQMLAYLARHPTQPECRVFAGTTSRRHGLPI